MKMYKNLQRLYQAAALTVMAGCADNPTTLVDKILEGRIKISITDGTVQYDLSQRLVELPNGNTGYKQGKATDFAIVIRDAGDARMVHKKVYEDIDSNGIINFSNRSLTLPHGDGATSTVAAPLFSRPNQEEYTRDLAEMLDVVSKYAKQQDEEGFTKQEK